MKEKFYTIDQVAEIIGMHHKTIRKFITEGRLRANKVGKQWRISGHDLSNFMENNNVKINTEKEDKDSVEFSTADINVYKSSEKINISTVIDINDVDKDQYMRISNTLLAVMNSNDPKLKKSTINIKYYDKEESLKVMLWGGTEFTKEMVDIVSMLVQ